MDSADMDLSYCPYSLVCWYWSKNQHMAEYSLFLNLIIHFFHN